MIRFCLAAILVCSTTASFACSICGDGFANRQTLRQNFHDAKLVAFGQLRNAKPAADGVGGTTEFHITQVLKADAGIATPAMIVIPRYYPLIGATPTEFVFFCAVAEGRIDPFLGEAATAASVKYLIEAVTAKEPLAFFAAHLEHADAIIAADAFLEFARARDTDIAALAPRFNRTLLRTWIADDKVPEERLGVYALMLGLSGNADDATWLAGLLKSPRSPRASSNLGGLLAGLIVLDGKTGWPMMNAILASQETAEKLAAVGSLRYLQSTRPVECREHLLAACRTLLADADLCDIAVDDLRRWAWWDLTPEVLKLFQDKSSPLLKRGIVRYSLACPDAKAFIEKLRVEDPKLVAKVEGAK